MSTYLPKYILYVCAPFKEFSAPAENADLHRYKSWFSDLNIC